MKKSPNAQDKTNAIGLSSLCNDVFGMKAWAHQKKERNDRQSVPWQWVLWGGLAFFCLGFAIQAQSLWVLVAAVAAAVILFLARSTEAVQPQVFLLTDSRTESEKAAYQNREREKRAPRNPRTRSANVNKSAPMTETQKPAVEKTTNAEAAEVATPAEQKPKPARRSNPRRASKPVTATDKPAPRRPRAPRKPKAAAQSALTKAPGDVA